MDVLSDVLRVVRLSGAVFFSAEFSAPWALDSPNPELLASIVMPEAECVILFHILTEGECTITCKGCPAVRLEAGDVIIFPHGESHLMCSHEGAKPTPIGAVLSQSSPDALSQVTFGGGGKRSRFICGYLNCDQRFNPLVADLPTMLVVRSRNDYTVEAVDGKGVRRAQVPPSSGTWLSTTMKFTLHEAKTALPGNAAMLGRLTELMFVEILRQYMQQVPAGRGGWLVGLNDVHVGKAIRLMHAKPAQSWTVEELARETGSCRSVLAERFTRLLGESPMRYLARWRIHLAKQMLREGVAVSVADVAASVGYESEAAFNRAFRRVEGSPPATWRKSAANALLSAAASLIGVKALCALDFADFFM